MWIYSIIANILMRQNPKALEVCNGITHEIE